MEKRSNQNNGLGLKSEVIDHPDTTCLKRELNMSTKHHQNFRTKLEPLSSDSSKFMDWYVTFGRKYVSQTDFKSFCHDNILILTCCEQNRTVPLFKISRIDRFVCFYSVYSRFHLSTPCIHLTVPGGGGGVKSLFSGSVLVSGTRTHGIF